MAIETPYSYKGIPLEKAYLKIARFFGDSMHIRYDVEVWRDEDARQDVQQNPLVVEPLVGPMDAEPTEARSVVEQGYDVLRAKFPDAKDVQLDGQTPIREG